MCGLGTVMDFQGILVFHHGRIYIWEHLGCIHVIQSFCVASGTSSRISWLDLYLFFSSFCSGHLRRRPLKEIDGKERKVFKSTPCLEHPLTFLENSQKGKWVWDWSWLPGLSCKYRWWVWKYFYLAAPPISADFNASPFLATHGLVDVSQWFLGCFL